MAFVSFVTGAVRPRGHTPDWPQVCAGWRWGHACLHSDAERGSPAWPAVGNETGPQREIGPDPQVSFPASASYVAAGLRSICISDLIHHGSVTVIWRPEFSVAF